MKYTLTIAALIALGGCASRIPDGPTAPPAWLHAPKSSNNLSNHWWKDFGDPKLDALVQRAWKHNPDIEVALQRVQAARADRAEALADFFPKAGLQLGWREGREKTRDTELKATDLKPWTANGGISWELDLTGKRRAWFRAAKASEATAWANWKGSRLLIATEVCAARLEESLYLTEANRQREQLKAETKATELSEELLDRGLINSQTHANRVSQLEMRHRTISELDRLTQNARLRLRRMVGGGELPKAHSQSIRIGNTPHRIPAKVWSTRPDMIAAEADVRRAFAIQDGARLDLLPTLSVGATGSVESSSLRDGYEIWKGSVGPSLDIPIWDPQRIAAMQRGKAKALEASAQYRSTSDKAVEEIESAYNNLRRYQSQLASFDRETKSKHRAWQDAEAQYQSGLISAIDRTQAGRSYAESAAAATRMRLQTLNAKLRLIRALGG